MTSSKRRREAVGIDKVIVSGTVSFENGEVTGALPGQVIGGPLYQAAQA
jgi:N-acyl-D-aspartate/D-glutamate deacylase